MPTQGSRLAGTSVLPEKVINRGLALTQLDLTLETCVFSTVYRTLFVYREPTFAAATFAAADAALSIEARRFR